jgi:hypothetical protein
MKGWLRLLKLETETHESKREQIRRSRFGFKNCRPISGVSVTQQLARGRSGALVVSEGLDAVYDN